MTLCVHVIERQTFKWERWPPGGTPHMKGVGMLDGNFELKTLKETNLGVAQPFFDP